MQIPEAWQTAISGVYDLAKLNAIEAFLRGEVAAGKRIFPPEERRFAALELVAPTQVKVVILGQDPYHGEGQAHGLAFSVPEGLAKLPPSLRNIFRELTSDLGCPPPTAGSLEKWAGEGVLLLNTVLSVEEGRAFSHRGRGWEEFTDAVIQVLARTADRPIVFMLWGAPAIGKKRLIPTGNENVCVIESAHPSPLSAYRGFFGSRPFSRANAFLTSRGVAAVNWEL